MAEFIEYDGELRGLYKEFTWLVELLSTVTIYNGVM